MIPYQKDESKKAASFIFPKEAATYYYLIIYIHALSDKDEIQ